MTNRERRLIISALYAASEWEKSVADSWCESDRFEEAKANARAKEYMELRKKMLDKEGRG